MTFSWLPMSWTTAPEVFFLGTVAQLLLNHCITALLFSDGRLAVNARSGAALGDT